MFLPKQQSSAQTESHPLPPCPSTPNCVRTSLEFESDSAQVSNAFDQAIRDMGASLINWDAETSQIHAEFTIPIFGWIDDVIIQIEKTEQGSIAFIRSSSREGTWDIWVNPIRVKKLNNRVLKIISS